MSLYSLPALLAFGINVSLVVIVLLDNPRGHAHRLFALLMFCFALWDVADIIVVNSQTPEPAAIGGAIIVASLLFASAFFLVFSFSYPRSIHSRLDRLAIRPLFLVLPLIFTVLAGVGLSQPIELRRFAGHGIYCYVANASGGVLAVATYAMVFVYLAWGIRNLILQLSRSDVLRERRQIVHMLSGTLAFALLVMVLDGLREHEELHFYATRALYLFISLSFAYVVLGNRLLVLRRLGREGVAYALVTGLVFAFYLVVIKSIAGVVGKELGVNSIVVEALLIFVLALIFRPLIIRIQTLIELIFRRSAFRRREEFVAFSREAFHLTTIPDLARAILGFARRTLSATDAELMVGGDHAGVFRGTVVPERSLALADFFARQAGRAPNAYEVTGLLKDCTDEGRRVLMPFGGGFVVPLSAEKTTAGLLLIGPKQKGRYSAEEEEFFAVFANEVANGLERILLMERVRAEELRVAKMEKLAALGRLTAGIAHEFRNPLNIIAASAQTILRHPDDRALHQETGRYILEEIGRLSRTIDDFLQFAKPHTPVWRLVEVDELLERMTAALRPKAGARGISLRIEKSESLPTITTSPQHLERALVNLGLNGIEAMREGDELVVSAHHRDTSVVFSVRDTGPGIPSEVQSRIFEPFVTTKQTGTGLGLPIVYMMVQSISARISFVSNPGGTTFTIALPINPVEQ